MKKVRLLVLLCIYVCPLAAMNPSSQEDEVSQVVKELTQEAQPKLARMAQLINHSPFPKQVGKEDFATLKKLARPQYSFLLEKLLEKQIVDANVFCVDNGKKFSLLGETIDYFARESSRNKSWCDSRAVQFLLNSKADPNQEWHFTKSDQKKRTCLMRETESGSLPLVVHLLDAGADPNAPGDKSILPLNFSMKHSILGLNEFYNISFWLVHHGAKPISKVSKDDFTLIRQLGCPKHISIVQKLLEQKIIDVNLYCDDKMERTTLLDEAIAHVTNNDPQEICQQEHDDMKVVRLLMTHGADPKKEGFLWKAASSRAKKLVELLLNLGVDPKCPSLKAQILYLPSQAYVYRGRANDWEIITSLLSAGADPYSKGEFSDTPVGFAQEHIKYVGCSEDQAAVYSKKRAEALLGLFIRCDKQG